MKTNAEMNLFLRKFEANGKTIMWAEGSYG